MSDTDPIRFAFDWGSRFRLSVLNLGLACCAIEFVAASMRASGLVPVTTATGEEPLDADVLVVAGTVTNVLAPAVLRLYDGLRPDARFVMSFGACANSGGPYWDSYCVTKGVDRLLPVDIYVPGCPPRPEALLAALQQLEQRVPA